MDKNYAKERFEKEISEELGIDKRIIAFIANHPLYFFKEIAQSNEERPVMIRYFGKFMLKPRAKKL